MRDRELRERSEPLRVGVLESVWFVQALCRAVRPLAAGEPEVACRQFMPTASRAGRPLALRALVVAVQRRYALAFASREAKSQQNQIGRQCVEHPGLQPAHQTSA